MRNMSFSLTTAQFRAGTKSVTRRLGWAELKRGDEFCAIVKGMGLKKGEKVERLGLCQVVSNQSEPLNAISKTDCILEGFPDFTAQQFVEMFCKHNDCLPTTLVNRIEFKRI